MPNKPATPKPFKGWAVFTPASKIVPTTINSSPSLAWRQFYCSDAERRRKAKLEGYTVRRVTVTPESSHER